MALLLFGFFRLSFGQTQLMVNGGFELLNAGEWKISGAGAYLTNGPFPASGSAYLTMGNVAGANQAVFQTIKFPTNLISASFGFQYGVVTSDVFGSNDVFTVYVLDTNHNILASLGSASNLNPTPNYVQVRTNLVTYTGQTNFSSFAGQTVQTYFQATTHSTFGSLTAFYVDNVSMLIGTTADIPLNDSFTNSITLSTNSLSVVAAATNNFASREDGEPIIAGSSGGHSLWWDWTAPGLGAVTIATAGSSFTTLVGVYTGSPLTNLTTVAANNGNSRGGAAQVTFNVTPGTKYKIAVDGFNGQSGTVALSLKFALDTKVPIVSITSPLSGAKLTNSTVVVQGKASDNLAVQQVQYRLENAAGTNDYQTAIGTNAWTATVTDLIPGPNIIRVRAIDTSGNISVSAVRSVTFVVVSQLTLQVNGNGTVTPNLNGQLLPIGALFTLRAKPASGSIFAGWSGDLVTNATLLKFTMQTNLLLQANFIPNPFIPVAGIYQGLFFDTNGVTHQSSGFVNVTVTSAGSYTARIILAGVSYALSGKFSATGASSASIAPRGLPRVAVQLQLDLTGSNGLMGQFSNGQWTADLNAFRAMSNPPIGNYTMLLPGRDGDSAQPGGDGFGTVKVAPLSTVNFAGTLGDGTKVTQKTILTTNGQWPFYTTLYAGKGSMLGWLTIGNEIDTDISGPLTWFKFAQPGNFYPLGFTNEVTAAGSAYRFTNGVPVLNFNNGQLWLTNGNLSASFTNQITLNSASKVTNQSSNALTLVITSSSGLFKGSVVNPTTRKPIVVNGVVLQKQNFGSGVFLGTNQTGRVYFGP